MMTWASWMYVCSCAYSFSLGILKEGEWTQSGNKLRKKAWVYEMYKHKDHPGQAGFYATFYVVCETTRFLMTFEFWSLYSLKIWIGFSYKVIYKLIEICFK